MAPLQLFKYLTAKQVDVLEQEHIVFTPPERFDDAFDTKPQIVPLTTGVKFGILITALFAALSADATILSFSEVVINFTNPVATITNATWQPANMLVPGRGFGLDASTNEMRDFWIQSVPVAIGTSWRPARAVNVSVKINPHTDDYCTAYVRYSPDKKHWSSWQALEKFKGLVEVPEVASAEYDKLLREYEKMDVPWASDEEAAVKWILSKQPDFFEKHQPFIGYVQLRIEGSLHGGTRIQKIDVELPWAVSGMAAIPRDGKIEKHRDGFWRFEVP